MAISSAHIQGVRKRADLLCPEREVEQALDRMAAAIAGDLAGLDPLVLCVMNGAVIVTGKLLPRLDFPLRMDYIHATRYREQTLGGQLDWIHRPTTRLRDRHLLIVDDILDEGITLAEIVKVCQSQGARSVRSAVLVEKLHGRGSGYQADYVGMQVADRYLFGYGMDYKGFLRNARGIFAVAESDLRSNDR